MSKRTAEEMIEDAAGDNDFNRGSAAWCDAAERVIEQLMQENDQLKTLARSAAGALEARAQMLKNAGLWDPGVPDIVLNMIDAVVPKRQ